MSHPIYSTLMKEYGLSSKHVWKGRRNEDQETSDYSNADEVDNGILVEESNEKLDNEDEDVFDNCIDKVNQSEQG